ncbi:TonB-dependent receptor [Aestuariicella sp. G3-2]|uniref:TonB-dependent receptor n=1 Tax=Pseudomaricurvus albidus TaxID=2842452 RepID=UPI001C0B2B4C|nr:TonB-dependent receptor [Aestuariicella albida]MBU3070941.1 TonB-dependent receptor [Aestuariicella albida]
MSKTPLKGYSLKHCFLGVSLLASAIHSAIASETWSIEEVVVTAQKRAQSSQDLGMAVSAISGESLRDQGISQAEDLARVIPNVSSLNVSGGGVPIVIVRGVGLQNFRVNDSPTTAFYVDDVYQTSVVSADFTMFDLERVELLKGPQGGLYGRNTISGAMQIISQRPDSEDGVNGYTNVEYGKFNRRKLEGAVGLPLSDRSALRVSGRWEESDDRQFESVTGGFDHGEIDRWAARAMLSFNPTDNVDLLFKVHGGADQSELPLMQPVGIFADLGAFNPNVGLSSLTQTLCDSVLAGQGVNGDCVYNNNATASDYGIQGDYDSASDMGGFLDNEWQGASLNAQFSFGDYVLTSISAYDGIDYRRFTDMDGLPIEHSHSDYNTEIDAWQQEFRLAYEGSDVVSWVVGINYAEDELTEASIALGKDGLMPVAFNGAELLEQNYEQSTEALAVYGHGEWRFADDWNLVGEMRYTDAKKSFTGQENLYIPAFGLVPFLAADDSRSFEDVSGKLALEWTPSLDLLVYASVSKGFKTGGFFGGFATEPHQYESYDSETILAYETGFKSDWLDGQLRVNGSLFFYDRSDVQQSATDTSGSVAVTRLTNVGDVEASGAELDVTYQPTRALSLQLGLGYTDSTLVDSDLVSATIPGLTESSIEGTNTPNYSRVSANFLGQYEQDLTDALYGRLQLEISYRSERDLNLVTNPLEDALLTEPEQTLTNVRAEVGSTDGSWKTILFVENLTDERYRSLMRDNGLRGMHTLYGDPRTWGVSFTYNW